MKKRTSSKLRYFLILLALLIVGGLIKAFFFSSEPKPTYITVQAYKSDLEQTVLADGSIAALKMVNVGAQVSGQIKALHVSSGDKIIKGQLIAEIDDLPQQNSFKEAEASLKNIQAQKTSKIATMKNSQIAFDRQKSLIAKGVGIKADYDSAKAVLDANNADVEALDAQIVRAQIAVDTAKLNLGYTKISSPTDGVVVAVPVEEGQTVNAVQSAPTIIKVAQLDVMKIEAQISEADVTKVKSGMPVYFTILGEPNKRYTATLRKVEPAPSSINDTNTSSSSSTTNAIFYNGLLDVPNPDGKLRISMTAQVYIVLAEAKDAVTVPATALSGAGQNGKQTIMVVDSKGNVTPRDVTVGINNNINAQIISGLEVGETVIVSSSGGAGAQAAQRRMSIRM